MRKVALPFLVAVSGCGAPTTPDGFPLVTGLYEATWGSDFTSVPGGVRTTGGPCPVTFRVSTQQGGTFEGTSERRSPCVPGGQQIRGSVAPDGRLTVDLVTPAGFQGFDECRHVSGDTRWRGALDGRDLELTIDVLLDCQRSGSLQTRSRLLAARLPD